MTKNTLQKFFETTQEFLIDELNIEKKNVELYFESLTASLSAHLYLTIVQSISDKEFSTEQITKLKENKDYESLLKIVVTDSKLYESFNEYFKDDFLPGIVDDLLEIIQKKEALSNSQKADLVKNLNDKLQNIKKEMLVEPV